MQIFKMQINRGNKRKCKAKFWRTLGSMWLDHSTRLYIWVVVNNSDNTGLYQKKTHKIYGIAAVHTCSMPFECSCPIQIQVVSKKSNGIHNWQRTRSIQFFLSYNSRHKYLIIWKIVRERAVQLKKAKIMSYTSEESTPKKNQVKLISPLVD